jgi:hypothetical protein
MREEGPATNGTFSISIRGFYLTAAAAAATAAATTAAAATARTTPAAPAVVNAATASLAPTTTTATKSISINSIHLFTPFGKRGGTPQPRQLANATTLAGIGYQAHPSNE